MYKMKADGVVFYDPSSDDTALHVLNPTATFEANKVDNLTFKMLPDNVMYDSFEKMVTIITLEQDDEVIFRGRVLEATSDKYNIKEVYCEGELGYLHDSCIRPYDFDGKAIDLFRQIVAWHNEQVDEYKRFEVGIITAIDEETEAKTDSQNYADALGELRQMFVTVHKGYLRVRTVDGVRYLDYIKEFDTDCSQPIAFGVNLVDIENKIDAGEVFSVLIPLGGYNTVSRNTPVDISSVNDGKDYLEDAEAIAKYGRIVKTYKWEDCKDPEELMARGYEQFAKLKENRTITIKAVDLHIIDTSYEAIRVGMNVQLQSDPHGLNEPDACTKIKLNIEKPEETEYTFGYPPESLTDSNVAKNRRTDYNYNGLHKWVTETNESFEVFVDEVNGKILLQAENIQTNSNNLTAVSANVEVLAQDLLVVSEDVTVWGDRIDAAANEISVTSDKLDAMADVIGLEARATGNDDETQYVAVRLDGIEGTLEQHATNIETNAANITTNASNIDVLSEDLLVVSQNVTVWGERIDAAAQDINTNAGTIDAIANVIGLEARESGVDDETQYVALRLDGIDGTLEQHATSIKTNAENITTNATNIETNASDIDVLSNDLLVVSQNVTVYGERIEAAAQDIDANAKTIDAMANVIGFEARESGNDDETQYVALRLDGIDNSLTAKADLILLDGYVKTTDLETGVLSVLEDANIDSIHAQSLAVDGNSSFHGSIDASGDVYAEGTVDATSVDTTNLTVAGSACKWTGGTVVTNFTVTQNKNNATVMLADGSTKWIQWVESVTITPTTAYINYMGKA